MERDVFEKNFRERLEKLSTTNLSDALDKIGLRGAVIGIRPLFGMPKIVGRAVTIKITAAGMVKSKRHLGVDAIASASPGDVIAIDNRGDIYNNCWGEILSCAREAERRGGRFHRRRRPRYRYLPGDRVSRFSPGGWSPSRRRGRIMQEDFNCPIRLGDVQVRPGDVLVGRREWNRGHSSGEAGGSGGGGGRDHGQGRGHEGGHFKGHGHPGSGSEIQL